MVSTPSRRGQTGAFVTLSDQTRDRVPVDGVATRVPASFVVWLAGQRVPSHRRAYVHHEVQRFLTWRDTQFAHDQTQYRPAAWCYLLRRQRAGEGEAELRKTWGALELFLNFLERMERLEQRER